MSICLAMLVKNEQRTILRAIESALPLIDSWCVVDTGSTDRTEEIIFDALRELPGTYHREQFVDFGTNRTALVEEARKRGSDHILVLDSDMEVRGEAPGELGSGAFMVKFLDRGLEYRLPLLVSADRTWRYVGKTHEYLDTSGVLAPHLDDFVIVHHADGGSRGNKFERDRALLEQSVLEDPFDDRAWFYLAQTYRDLELRERAVRCYRMRARLGGWDEEVFYATLQAGILDRDKATLIEAHHLRPHRAEPLYWLARFHREDNNLHAARVYADQGCRLPIPNDILFVHTWIYEHGCREELWLAEGVAA